LLTMHYYTMRYIFGGYLVRAAAASIISGDYHFFYLTASPSLELWSLNRTGFLRKV
jgi:hypothetical protein